MDLSTVGIVGVGGLGLVMAERLIAAGHQVVGYRRSAMDDLIALGGVAASSGKEVAERADAILVCLPGAEALDDVLTRPDGLGEGLRDGNVVVEMSTTSVAEKRDAADRAAARGATLLDCPISGTPSMMRAGRAAIFASGDAAAVEACRPVLEAVAPKVSYVGAVGGGSVAKFVANLLVGIHNLAAAEALAFAAREGADPVAIHEAIKGSVATSGMFELRGAMMAKRDYGEGGSLGGFLRGLEVIAKEAESIGAPTPLLTKAIETSHASIAAGFNAPDQAVVFEYLLAEAEKS